MAAFDFNALLARIGDWRQRPAAAMPQMGQMGQMPQAPASFGGGKGPMNAQVLQQLSTNGLFGGSMPPTGLLGPGNPLNTPMRFNPIAAPTAASPFSPTTKPLGIPNRATNPGDYGR